MTTATHDPSTHRQICDPPVGWANGHKGPYQAETVVEPDVGTWTRVAWTFATLAWLMSVLTVGVHAMWPWIVYTWPVALLACGAAKARGQRWFSPLVAVLALPVLASLGAFVAWWAGAL